MQRRRALLACCGGCPPRRIDETAWGTARRYARVSPCPQTAVWPHTLRWGSMPCPVNLAIQTAPSAHRIRIAWTQCPDSAPALLQTVLRVFPAGPPGCSCLKKPSSAGFASPRGQSLPARPRLFVPAPLSSGNDPTTLHFTKQEYSYITFKKCSNMLETCVPQSCITISCNRYASRRDPL